MCKLNRSLYGLRTAPRSWFDSLSSHLKSIGFIPSPCDPCLYRRQNTFITVFVDDLLLFGPDEAELASLLSALNNVFKLKDLGPVSRYLGMEVKHNRAKGEIVLTQQTKIEALVRDAALEDAIPRKTPLNPGTQLPFPADSPALSEAETTAYQSFLGRLMHIACFTRPDIMHAVSTLAHAQQTPSRAAQNALLHVVRYLKGTATVGIRFTSGSSLALDGFSDANWATDSIAHSTSGVVFLANKAPVLWFSKKQTLVARSTCEAEYVAADLAAREATWLQALWADVSRTTPSPITLSVVSRTTPSPISLSVDNKSAVQLTPLPFPSAWPGHVTPNGTPQPFDFENR